MHRMLRDLFLIRLFLLMKMFATVEEKNLTGFGKERFSPKNFHANEGLRFQDVLSAIN